MTSWLIALTLTAALTAPGDSAVLSPAADTAGVPVPVAGYGTVPTRLVALQAADRSTVRMYSAGLDERADPATPHMIEVPWDSGQLTTLAAYNDEIVWVLNNSYPALTLTAVHQALADKGARPILPEVIAATQMALWHFLEGVDLDRAHAAPNVRVLYDHLTDPAIARGAGRGRLFLGRHIAYAFLAPPAVSPPARTDALGAPAALFLICGVGVLLVAALICALTARWLTRDPTE